MTGILKELPLLELIPRLSPEFFSPVHLVDWTSLMERADTEPVRGLCAIPIRHGKTETTMHGIVWLLLRDPSRRIIFLTYSLEAAQKRGKRLRQLAAAAGVGPMRGYDTITDWQNEAGGGVVVMSADQSKLGLDCHVLVFDDPSDEHDSDDPNKREEVDATITHYTARCMRRGQPGPVLGVMSRWHPDDAVGRRLARRVTQWEYVSRQAIEDDGTENERAFAPNVWSIEQLKKVRLELAEKDPSERIWYAQFQNNPRPATAEFFGEPHYYSELPAGAFRIGHGCDFAFSQNAGSDFYARISGRVYGNRLYIVDSVRHRIDPVAIESSLAIGQERFGKGPIYTYQSGPEIGLSRVLIERGLPVAIMPARYNKLVRAQRTIKRYNMGHILFPVESACPWVPGLIQRLRVFRGHDKDRDDEADALVSMADGMMGGAVASGCTTMRGGTRMGTPGGSVLTSRYFRQLGH